MEPSIALLPVALPFTLPDCTLRVAIPGRAAISR